MADLGPSAKNDDARGDGGGRASADEDVQGVELVGGDGDRGVDAAVGAGRDGASWVASNGAPQAGEDQAAAAANAGSTSEHGAAKARFGLVAGG